MTPAGTRAWVPYCGAAPEPGEWLSRWNFDPVLIAGILGLFLLIRRGSGKEGRLYFAAAGGLAILLFISPFCALSSALFTARVTHHVLLTAVLAPLLVMSIPVERLRWTGSLGMWTALQAAIFWWWHAPPAYSQAMSSDMIYWAMQLTLLVSAFGFWDALRRSPALAAVAALLASTVQMGLLGALITFAGRPLYAPHSLVTESWGLSALDDQQMAGLIMWAPAAGLYLGAALFLVHRWFANEEGRFA